MKEMPLNFRMRVQLRLTYNRRFSQPSTLWSANFDILCLDNIFSSESIKHSLLYLLCIFQVNWFPSLVINLILASSFRE